MNLTVELVNEWALFEQNHPSANLEDFCRHYLITNKAKLNKEVLFDGFVPPRPDLILSKIMGRISKMQTIYAELALADIGIRQFEEFLFLNSIYQLKDPKKTEVIYHNMQEVSTGLLILGNLKKDGYLEEKDDPDDKRSKRVSLTPEGEKVLWQCYKKLGQAGEIMFGDMEEDDISLCIQLLKNLDDKFSKLIHQHKSKSFDAIYESMVSRKD